MGGASKMHVLPAEDAASFEGELADGIRNILRCPNCGSRRLVLSTATRALDCGECGAGYAYDPSSRTASLIAPSSTAEKSRIRTFWGDVCRQWYAENDRTLDADELRRQLGHVESFFRSAGHLAAVEMDFEGFEGRRVLEIGSGGGAHSALFKLRGASIISVDITPERVLSTARKLNLIPEGRGFAVEADAESLPFADASFDIVYSNGVLHHSTDTRRCISEVRRVLKPGGRAVVMLYARNSAIYWCRLLPRTILNLSIFRMPEAERLGMITEGKSKFADQPCPITRVYSEGELRALLGGFESVQLRKGGFEFSMVFPARGMQLRNLVLRLLGFRPTEASTILYGQPVYPATAIERWLGRKWGFDWNIVARMPSGDAGQASPSERPGAVAP